MMDFLWAVLVLVVVVLVVRTVYALFRDQQVSIEFDWSKTNGAAVGASLRQIVGSVVSRLLTNMIWLVYGSAYLTAGLIHRTVGLELPGADLVRGLAMPLGAGLIVFFGAAAVKVASRRTHSLAGFSPFDVTLLVITGGIAMIFLALVELALYHPAVFTEKVNLLATIAVTVVAIISAVGIMLVEKDLSRRDEEEKAVPAPAPEPEPTEG